MDVGWWKLLLGVGRLGAAATGGWCCGHRADWAFVGGAYVFHPGYWGPHIGYYGGINYGYGYSGVGFAGGRWVGNTFAYNRTVSNVDTSVIHSTYNEAVANNVTLYKPSYNGGLGGTTAAPTAQERFVAAEPHIPPTPQQRQRVQQAAKNPALTPQANPGHPAWWPCNHRLCSIPRQRRERTPLRRLPVPTIHTHRRAARRTWPLGRVGSAEIRGRSNEDAAPQQ